MAGVPGEDANGDAWYVRVETEEVRQILADLQGQGLCPGPPRQHGGPPGGRVAGNSRDSGARRPVQAQGVAVGPRSAGHG